MSFDPHAQAWLRSGVWYFTALSQTTHGFWQVTGAPVRMAAVASERRNLGEAVLACLGGSQPDFQADPQARNELPEVAKAAGARSWAAFMRGARQVGILRRGGTVYLSQGYVDLDEPGRVHLEAATEEAIGDALLSLCA